MNTRLNIYVAVILVSAILIMTFIPAIAITAIVTTSLYYFIKDRMPEE